MECVPEAVVNELDKNKAMRNAVTASEQQRARVENELVNTISPSHTDVTVHLRAETGATVISPVFTGNHFGGPVNVFSTTTAGELQSLGVMSQKQEDEVLQKVLKDHKDYMKTQTRRVFEVKREKKTLLSDVYTELFITEGDITDVYDEHEVQRIDRALKPPKFDDTPIDCNDIFRLLREKEDGNTVLTKGIAGIGKTFSVHKFILDWAEGKANQDLSCVFLLPFREMNLIGDEKVSLHELLLEFYPDFKDVKNTKFYEKYTMAFIFDGLDECRQPLEFSCRPVRDVYKESSVGAIFTSLVQGKLLRSALIWVTSRPAAANLIPLEFVGLFTEVRGFTDQQKEEYFRKRIKDGEQASKIILHIRRSRSLYIMCHIPVFCWIAATVLQDIPKQNDRKDIPSTLTEMYIHFLLIQMNIKNQKYGEKPERDRTKLLSSNKDMISKLAKLAFEQLKKENIMFYEKDLNACGIDPSDESTGLCTEIFKKDSVLHELKVYYFIHLSMQEFLAALHVFLCCLKMDMKELEFFLGDSQPKKDLLQILLMKAIDKAKNSDRGHLDLFLRFLLGISLESNQNLLIGLLDQTQDNKRCISKTVQYLKQLQNNDECLDKSINHFFCILELQDRSLYQQIMKYLNLKTGQPKTVSRSNCSVLVYVLLMSEEILDEFDPKIFNKTYAGCRRLVSAMRCCRKALFSDCGLTESCCETVASALQLEESPLRELDLSHNYSIRTAVKVLSAGLRSPNCQLETLRLARCYFDQDGSIELISAIQTLSHRLRELDLSGNDLQDSGLHHLLQEMKNTEKKLQVLRLSWCNLTEKTCMHISMLLNSDSPLRELDLSNNDLQDSGVKMLSDGLKSSDCQLEILRLSGCMVTEEGCGFLSSALSSNPSHLRELDLSYNHPGDSGVKLLTHKLEDPKCRLETLNTDPMSERFIKQGIRKYACNLTLDPNTAHVKLCLSDDDRTATLVTEIQPYPDHPDRFEPIEQVLSRESLSGRCYWEAEWTGQVGTIGITYKDILRKKDDIDLWEATSQLGNNHVSWKVTNFGSTAGSYISHDTEDINIKSPFSCSFKRAGVYVDTTAGVLSFYSITDTLSHLHTYLTSFTKPLYAAFKVESDSVSFCPI